MPLGTSMNKQHENITILNVLDAISDISGRNLFTSIATNVDSFGMSHRLYYTRVSKLAKTDLVKRKNGKYVLTTFGMVIYQLQLRFLKAMHDHPMQKSDLSES
jgi:hypothetical protein